MSNERQSYHEEFEQLIGEIRRELRRLKQENTDLRQKNQQLRQKLNTDEGNGDLFADLSENERLAMRQQIKELINRIDHHISNNS